jgi:glycosyltransferase involved in cell wall biosynthesis
LITLLHTEASLGWGGQEMRILREMSALPRESFRLLLACQPTSQIAREAKARELGVECITIRGNIDPLAVWNFIRLYRRHRVDIVHTHSNADSWNAALAAKFSVPRPWVVRTRHLSASFNNRLIYNFMADRVVTTGEYVRQFMVQEKKIDARKILAIPSGVNLERFNPRKVRENLRKEFGIPAEAPVFGIATIFRKKKGLQDLLKTVPEILRSFPEAKLLLVGEGPQERNYRRLIEEVGIRNAVVMPGFQEDVPRVLNTLDVFVFPTLEEAFPNAVQEAMAMEKPVVATRVGGVPDIVQDGETGFLVGPGDCQAIAERVVRLLRDPELRREMGRKGRRFVEAYCSQSVMVHRLEQLYLSLMEKGKN